MPFHSEYLWRASDKLRPIFGPTRKADPAYYSRRIVHALRTKETGTRLARALALWGTVHIGDWNQPEGYETWLKSLRVLVDAVDEDDAASVVAYIFCNEFEPPAILNVWPCQYGRWHHAGTPTEETDRCSSRSGYSFFRRS